MTVKYIAFDGKEFDNEEKCKEYERYVGEDDRRKIGEVRDALRTLDGFCNFWFHSVPNACCGNCPLTGLCDQVQSDSFEELFNEENPFGNVDVDGTIIEED